jgi:hypothetical protein
MNNQIDNLKKTWQEYKSNDLVNPADKDQIIRIAKQKLKSTVRMQTGTILVLIITLVVIALYFFYVANFKQTISHIGAYLMMTSVALRIIIELVSIYLSATINMSETALNTNNASLTYYQFRKRVNGSITIAIIIVYTIGFYMLTPEFRLYFNKPMIILIDISYIFLVAILMWFIRKKIKKEMDILTRIFLIQNDINEGND